LANISSKHICNDQGLWIGMLRNPKPQELYSHQSFVTGGKQAFQFGER